MAALLPGGRACRDPPRLVSTSSITALVPTTEGRSGPHGQDRSGIREVLAFRVPTVDSNPHPMRLLLVPFAITLLGSCSSTLPTRVWHAPAVAPRVASCPMTDPVVTRSGIRVTRRGALHQSPVGGLVDVDLISLTNPCVTGDERRWALVIASESDTILYLLGSGNERVETLQPLDPKDRWYQMSSADLEPARSMGWKVVQVGWESSPVLRTCLDTTSQRFALCPR